MVIYQRMYNEKNIYKFYLSPYVEYYVDDLKICLYNFESEKIVQLKIKNGEILIKDLKNGMTHDELNQKLLDLFGERELAEKILILLIQNKIIE